MHCDGSKLAKMWVKSLENIVLVLDERATTGRCGASLLESSEPPAPFQGGEILEKTQRRDRVAAEVERD